MPRCCKHRDEVKMKGISPEGPNWSYRADRHSFSDEQRYLIFPWAVGFGPIAGRDLEHKIEPPEATDEQVRAAIEAAGQDEATDAEVFAALEEER